MQRLVVVRLLVHVLVAVFKLLVMAPRWTNDQRAAEIARWSRTVFKLLDIRLVVRDAPPRESTATLFAGNHVSWLDIHALLAVADVRFVAKSEVRDWPVVGWLATQLGTRFIVRNRRCEAYTATTEMRGLLNAGQNVCIFPEGSTTDGASLQPFHAALFEPAAAGRTAIQPFAIRYLDGQGLRTNAAAFVGDMSIGESLGTLLRHRDVTCEIVFLPQVETAGKCRRALARETEFAVMTALGVPVSYPTPPQIDIRDTTSGDLALA